MKRLLLVLGGVFLFTTLGPVPSANAWWWHRHSKSNSKSASAAKTPKAAKSPKSPKAPKQPKSHREKSHVDSGSHLYNFPRSIGWRHKSPGPAGAGGETITR